MFLLLFEGGRSRYLIQFLPFFYLLSAIGWESVLTTANRRKKKMSKLFIVVPCYNEEEVLPISSKVLLDF